MNDRLYDKIHYVLVENQRKGAKLVFFPYIFFISETIYHLQFFHLYLIQQNKDFVLFMIVVLTIFLL